MSSLHLDASGNRSLNLTLNDVTATHAGMPSRNDDDVTVSINSCSELSFVLPAGARLERRRFQTFDVKDGEKIPTGSRDELVVVLGDRQKGHASLSLLGRNRDPELVAAGDTYGMMPQVNVSARKNAPAVWHESGEVVGATTAADVLQSLEA